MEALHLLLLGFAPAVHVELVVDAVVYDEAVGHGHALGLHWVLGRVGVFADLGVVEVGHSARGAAELWPVLLHY